MAKTRGIDAERKLNRRDASKIADLAAQGIAINAEGEDFAMQADDLFRQIAVIAKRMDARTGTSDPSTKK